MAPTRRHARVVNLQEVAPAKDERGGFGRVARRLGSEAGGLALGCTHFELPPGKTAFPFHFHSAVEEAIYVLEGSGSLRIGGDEVALRAGDYVAMPPGPEFSHALRNSGSGPLRYLCISGPAAPATMDIVVYPDSRKIGLASGVKPGTLPWRDGAWVLKLIREAQPDVDYYADEPLAER